MERIKNKFYLKPCLALFGLLLISSCQSLDNWGSLKNLSKILDDQKTEVNNDFIRYDEVEMSRTPLIEYLDDNSKESRFYATEIRKACDYTKLPFKTTISQTFTKPLPSTRVVCVYDTRKLSEDAIEKLRDFVAQGGTLFVPFAYEDHRMSFMYGFKPEAEYGTDSKSAGYKFIVPYLPTLQNKSINANILSYGFDAQNFSSKVRILATAANNPKQPAIVQNNLGEGRVVLYNATVFNSKEDRGFLFAGLLNGLQGIPYPVVNTTTVFLDDFPSPLYDIKEEPVATEMDMTMRDFVLKVWWPDMSNLAVQTGIKYSAMVAFDYKNNINPPFTLDQWNSTKVKVKNKIEPAGDWLMRDIDKKGHELSLHGYNHVEFTTKDWKNMEFIPLGLQTVVKKWNTGDFGALPITYVPPSDYIDRKGLAMLKKGFPSIRYMCSLYLGELHEGCGREFDYDPYMKDFFDFPRISSGYYMPQEDKYNVQSEYLITGIWNHFVHPDDVYQIPANAGASAGDFDLRNGDKLGWKRTKGSERSMLGDFTNYMKLMTKTYPQMRFQTGGDGGQSTIKWRASRFDHIVKDGLYKVTETNNINKNQYWFLYADSENSQKVDDQLRGEDVIYSKIPMMTGYLYSCYTSRPELTSVDLLYKSKQKLEELEVARTRVAYNNLLYSMDLKKYIDGEIYVDNTAKMFRLELANLKDRMLSTASIDSAVWNKYARYMSWDEKGNEVWDMLDKHVEKYSTVNNIMYSAVLDKVVSYPSMQGMERWMSLQMTARPDDVQLLKMYIDNFNTPEHIEKIRSAYTRLISLEPNEENFLNYYQYMIEHFPNVALKEILGLEPGSQFGKEVASSFAWFLADNKYYAEAYEWSKFASKVDFMSRMNWLIELKRFPEIEREYLEYIEKNPTDESAKALMSSVYHEMGRFRESWVLANALLPSREKDELRKTLNKDVGYEKRDLQENLIANEVALFYPDVLKEIMKQNRLLSGNYIETNSALETNRERNAVFKNLVSYNMYSKKGVVHSFGATFNKYYAQTVAQEYYNNYDNSLKGIEYKYSSAGNYDIEGKINYWSRIRAELDERNAGYYQIGVGANRSKNKKFTSAALNFFPTETAPAMNEKIYQLRLNLYTDRYLYNKVNASISAESNYYTNGLLTQQTFTNAPVIDPNARPNPSAKDGENMSKSIYTAIDENTYRIDDYDATADAAITARFAWDNGEKIKSRFIPFIEGQYSRGSRDLSSGYPYWMIRERLYGGGGLGWALNIPNFYTKLEASYFLDSYSSNFQRYSGNFSYQLWNFTALSATFEFFAQEKYYSNAFQFGIKYNLKKKLRKN